MAEKHRIFILIGSVTVSLGIITLLLATSAKPAAPDVSSVPTQTALYTLGDWEGQLALFLTGESRPDRLFDVHIASLPAEEQERLKSGIPIADEETLARLLEDYTS